MFTIVPDVMKNRIVLTIMGRISKVEAGRLVRGLVAAVTRMRPGFDVINDISRATIGDPEVMTVYRNVTEFLGQRGVGRIVRVVGGSREAVTETARATRGLGTVTPSYLPTLEEAERMLDEQKPPSAGK